MQNLIICNVKNHNDVRTCLQRLKAHKIPYNQEDFDVCFPKGTPLMFSGIAITAQEAFPTNTSLDKKPHYRHIRINEIDHAIDGIKKFQRTLTGIEVHTALSTALHTNQLHTCLFELEQNMVHRFGINGSVASTKFVTSLIAQERKNLEKFYPIISLLVTDEWVENFYPYWHNMDAAKAFVLHQHKTPSTNDVVHLLQHRATCSAHEAALYLSAWFHAESQHEQDAFKEALIHLAEMHRVLGTNRSATVLEKILYKKNDKPRVDIYRYEKIIMALICPQEQKVEPEKVISGIETSIQQ